MKRRPEQSHNPSEDALPIDQKMQKAWCVRMVEQGKLSVSDALNNFPAKIVEAQSFNPDDPKTAEYFKKNKLENYAKMLTDLKAVFSKSLAPEDITQLRELRKIVKEQMTLLYGPPGYSLEEDDQQGREEASNRYNEAVQKLRVLQKEKIYPLLLESLDLGYTFQQLQG